ncbi:hypothetical protein QFC19_002313 [Naganishia cerealis]|uniref:Uncharacterized protein n=1 Tax=Naganishia cerealis TaxID=610337 RepID=A0ACC2WC03_9TREE|nr:hypothetical protein QFC19_002313 [Naganishia cerealis]
MGQDYPSPMLDEKQEKERCIARLKIAYQVNLHGNSPEVIDGRAEEILKQKFKQVMGKEDSNDNGNCADKDMKGGVDLKRKAKSNYYPASGPMDAFVKRQKQ